jgi:hypothetical protein
MTTAMTDETRAPGIIARSRRFFQDHGFWFVLAVLVVGTFIIRQPGADFSRYVDWARAFRHADILELSQDGIWSPFGVPLSQWQFGTGLVYALPGFLVSPDLLVFPAITSCIGLLFFFLTLRRVTRDPFTAILLFCLAWVSTPLGFYTFAQSSESLAATFLSIYFYLITSGSRRSLGFYFLCGIAGGFVVSSRTQLGIWIAAGIPLLVAGISGQRASGQATRARALASLVLFGAPLLAALAASQMVNRWMTGSALLSPYVFGDAGFKSVDLVHPHLLAVLLHPWHGLLTYHPFFLVPMVLLGASVVSLLRGRFSGDNLFATAVFVAFCVQLWIQSAWYCWWLGTDTFGMRAFAPAVVPVLIAAAPLYEKALQGRAGGRLRSVGTMTVFSFLAMAWSGLLLTQGATNFTSLSSLLEGQVYGLSALVNTPSTFVAGTVAIGLVWMGFGRPTAKSDSPSRTPACLAMAALLFLLLRAVLAQEGAVPLVALLASAVLLALVFRHFETRSQPKVLNRLMQVAGLVLAVSWLCAQIVFVRLAIRVESQLRPNPEGQTFHVQEVFASYREYLEVSGFEDEKRALADFLSKYRDVP